MSYLTGMVFIALGLVAVSAQAQDAATLQQAERRGAELFDLERVIEAARAAGEDVRAYRRDDEIAGWVATRSGDIYQITFIRLRRGGEPVGRYRISVNRTGQALGGMERLDDLPLDAREAAQFRARQNAEATPYNACSASYETLVFPDASGGWSAYLMPHAAFSDVLLLGGTYRAQVSGDGNTVTSFGPLASGCAVLQNPADADALRFDDPAGGEINELHAYIGGRAGKPLYVNTGGKSWLVNAGRIQTVPESP